MASIELKGISKSFGDMMGVERLDLEIADEEMMVLLGPSGCGKTTTMRMIAGLVEPTTGDILIDGERVNDVEPRDRDVAMVFQSYALYPNMTIYENIRFPLRMRGVPRDRQDALVREAARVVQMEDYLNRKPKALSGGQRQRAALARATVRHPRVFLMDEPLSNLDAKLRLSMRAELKHVQRQLRITTVYVTHDQIEAMTLADRISVLDRGRIQQIGTPDDIYNQPANTFVAGFIGSPPMNLIAGRTANGRFTRENCRVDGIPVDGTREITVGVRPEDAYVSTPEEGHIQGRLYGLEPTGDQTILSVDVGDQLFTVKADRDFRQELASPLAVRLDVSRLHYFDGASGERIGVRPS